MNFSQFPEHHRAFVLSGVVRNNRNGIAISNGVLEGTVLNLTVRQVKGQTFLSETELKASARAAFGELPYELVIKTE